MTEATVKGPLGTGWGVETEVVVVDGLVDEPPPHPGSTEEAAIAAAP
jgi:hypothetical protein